MRDRISRQQGRETPKTVSRKSLQKQQLSALGTPSRTPAGSRLASAVASPAMSRIGSRAGSTNATDDEDSSEEGSTYSMTEFGRNDEELNAEEQGTWEALLSDVIQDIIDWKRSSTDGREQALRTYTRILQQRYAEEEISGKEQDLLISILRSIKQNSSVQEVEIALKALEVTAATSGLDSLFEDCAPRVKRTIQEDDISLRVKVAAIHTFAMLAFYAGFEDEGLLEHIDFLLDIISTDGESIGAENAAEPVIAAIQAYSLLASSIEDLSDHSDDHVETLMEQLDSAIPMVQVAAAEAIALLHEKSYTEPEGLEDINTAAKSTLVTNERGDVVLIRRYQASSHHNEIIMKLSALASSIGRAKRKDIKVARKSFKYVFASIENPTYGPMYDVAERDEGVQQGNRLVVKLNNTEMFRITKWYQYMQFLALKNCFKGGLLSQWHQQNPAVYGYMPSKEDIVRKPR